MNVGGTLVGYWHTCRRKLWLHANGIRMEHTSDVVTEGKQIGESTYRERADRNTEIEIEGVKIDFYDPVTRTVHETKKSDKMEFAHTAQVKYYLWLLENAGIESPKGVIEYPRLRKTTIVELIDADRKQIPVWVEEIRALVGQEFCPPPINKGICKQCSYFDFCYADEEIGEG